MPLNPNISLAYKGIELQNPLDQYGKVMALQSAQQQNALAQRQMQEYDRSLQESEGIRNRLAGGAKIDDPETYNFLLGSKTGREILKQEVDLQKERTLQQKTEGELFDQRMKQIRELWGNVQTPEQAMAVHEATHLDPIVGKRLAAWNMTEQSGRQSILDAAKDPSSFAQFVKRAQLGAEKFMELNKPTTMQINRGGQTDLIQVPGMGGAPTTVGAYADVPEPEQVHVQKVAEYRAGATSVNVSTDKAYGSAIGKLAAEEDIALHQKAQSIPTEIKKVDETLNVLRNSNINTGIGAEVFTVLDQAKAQFTNDKAAGKRVTDTQYLDSLLGSSVFPQISALGIGARGLDTPAEREFLRKVITGTISLNKDTLIKMTELRRRGLQDAANVYNNKVKSGELDRFFEGTGRSRALIELPEAPASRKPTTVLKAPSGVDSALWNAMTPQERALWQK